MIGSGAAGFAAAVTARALGLDVLMAEKAAQFGGTTVSSAGVIWIPGSRQARAHGIEDSAASVLAYLSAQGGNRLDRDMAEAYASEAADILEWFETHSHLRCALAPAWPDYHPTEPGGAAGGRSLGPQPFDGRTLGVHFRTLRPPIATTMIFGGMIVGREDLMHFYGMQRSLRSMTYVGRLFARYLQDRLAYSRGTRLSNGSALVAMLARTAFESGVRLHLRSPMERLLREHGRITGAFVAGVEIRARLGVVLATGGFPASEDLRTRYYDHVAQGLPHHTLAPRENVGDGLRAASEVDVALVENQKNPAAWTPVSLAPQKDGALLPFPHFFDRGKAGYIAVNRQGRRFV
ncbi:MAG: FAD-binding protein, partial [Caulobacterales bacterium]